MAVPSVAHRSSGLELTDVPCCLLLRGVDKHRFGKRFYAMPMILEEECAAVWRSSQWLPLRKPARPKTVAPEVNRRMNPRGGGARTHPPAERWRSAPSLESPPPRAEDPLSRVVGPVALGRKQRRHGSAHEPSPRETTVPHYTGEVHAGRHIADVRRRAHRTRTSHVHLMCTSHVHTTRAPQMHIARAPHVHLARASHVHIARARPVYIERAPHVRIARAPHVHHRCT